MKLLFINTLLAKPVLIITLILLLILTIYLYRVFPWMRLSVRKPDVIFVIGLKDEITSTVQDLIAKEYELHLIEDADDCYPYHKRLCLFIIGHDEENKQPIEIYEKFKVQTKGRKRVPVLFIGEQTVLDVQLQQWKNRGHDFMVVSKEESLDKEAFLHQVECLIGKRKPYLLPKVGKSFLGKYKIAKEMPRKSVYCRYNGTATENNIAITLYFLPSEYWSFEIKKRLRDILDLSEDDQYKLSTLLAHQNDSYIRYFILQNPDGIALDQWIAKSENIQPENVKVFFGQLAKGLKIAHQMQLYHGHIRPQNIYFPYKRGTTEPDYRSVQLRGFELWPHYKRVVGAEMISTGRIAKNTLELQLLAPENIESEVLDQRTDLHALGCCICYGLQGKEFSGSFYVKPQKDQEESLQIPDLDISAIESTDPDKIIEIARKLMQKPDIAEKETSD